MKTTLRIPVIMHQKLRMLCAYNKTSMTQFINDMIDREFKKHKEIK